MFDPPSKPGLLIRLSGDTIVTASVAGVFVGTVVAVAGGLVEVGVVTGVSVGVGVFVGVLVWVGVLVGVLVGVGVVVGVLVSVGVKEGVLVLVDVGIKVIVGMRVGVGAGRSPEQDVDTHPTTHIITDSLMILPMSGPLENSAG